MTDSGRVPDRLLRELLVSQLIDTVPLNDFMQYFLKAQRNGISPQIKFSVDPRSDEPIIYNPARAERPHDNSDQSVNKKIMRETCPICAGETTGIIDLADLSDGYTFINSNLYPAIRPPDFVGSHLSKDHSLPWGFHLVQWTSSVHDQDWHNMMEADCVIVMSRLAAAEKKLIDVGREIKDQSGDEVYISVIKNSGAAVGGSLEHGHQQILLSNLAPRRLIDNQRFVEKKGKTFSEHLQVTNPAELLLYDYGEAVLVVSQYMRRPLEMILALKDTGKSYLHQLDERELLAVSRGWMDASRIFHNLMPDYDREIAYNFITHNGPGAGLYFEFLPYTQEQGGFEQLGLTVCQADPLKVADQIRMILEG